MAGRGRDPTLPAWQQGPGGVPGGPPAQHGFPSHSGWPGGPSQPARPSWGAPQQGGYPGMQRPQYGAPQASGPQPFPGPPRQGMPQMGQHPNQGYHPMPGPGGMRPAGNLPPAPQMMAPSQMQQPFMMPQQQMQGRGPPVQASPTGPQGGLNPAQSSPAGGQLKGGWTEHTAPSGRKYYYQAATKTSSWTRPVELEVTLSDQVKTEAPSTTAIKPEVQCDWKEFTSPDGRKYYYNRVTKTSVWQMPEELKMAQALAASKTKQDPGNVQVLKLADPSPGRPSPASTPGVNGTAGPQLIQSRWNRSEPANAGLPEPKKPIVYATKEEAKDAFRELLASVGTASNASWESTMRLIVNDPRYEAFKTIGEKKACFNEYLQLRAKEEKEESRSKAKQNRDAFFTLLELSPELRTGTRYSKAAALFDDEPRWKAIREPREREQLFNEHMKERERKDREHRRAELKKKKSAFKALLEANKGVRVDSVWRKVQGRLEGEDEYENLDKVERLEVFQDHIRDLEKKEKEHRHRDREERRRVERNNRDAFKELINIYKDDSKIVPKMRWKDFHALVEAEDALKAIEKNSSGSRPRELFEDALEEVEEVYIKNQTLMRAAKLDLQAETDYADFAAAFEASTDESLGAIPEHHRRLFFEEEIGKLKEKAAKEERRRRKMREDFQNLLRDTRRIKYDTAWPDAKALLEKEPEYKAMESREKEEIFIEYIEKLKEKREKEKDREREKEEKRARKAEEEEKPRKDKKRHKKERHGDKEKGSDKKSKDKERHPGKRRHEDSEEEDDKRSGKKHRKDKGKDRHKSKDQGAPDASPGGSASEPEPAAQEALPSPEKPIRDGTHQRSDSEEGQL